MKAILTIILTLSMVSTSFGAIKLKKEDEAPFAGILTSEFEFNSMVKDIKVGEINKQLVIHYKNVKDLDAIIKKNQTKQVTILSQQNDKLSDQLYKYRESSNLQKTVWFVLGVLSTGLAVKLAGGLYD